MEPDTVLAFTAATDLIKQSFTSIFQSANLTAETGFQSWKLKTLSRDRFAEHVIRSVGSFPLFGTTKQASVESSYVRITLSSDLERNRYRSRDAIVAGIRQQKIGDTADAERTSDRPTLIDALERTHLGVALVGLPGSGKTTALRHLALSLAKGQSIRGHRVLPIYLPVRDLAARGQSINDAARELLDWLDIPGSADVLHSLLRSGDIALLVDGLDEVDSQQQSHLIEELSSIRTRYMKVVVCISARPHSLEMGLSGFEKYETLSLSLVERLELVRKWFAAVDVAKGKQLIANCKNDPSLLELGSNPLLLSIVCALYYNDLKIPTEPDELYARMIEGLLGAWDAFRNIARHTPLKALTVRRRVVIASWLAAATFDAGKLIFTASEVEQSGVLHHFATSTRTDELEADTLLRSLYNDFGILIERAPGIFSFSHLTLQEYLAALHVVDNRRELETIKKVSNQEWREVIRLVAKMLPRADEFLSALTEKVDLTSRYETELLALVWKSHPICEPERIRKIMTALGSRTVAVLQNVSVTYGRDGESLTVHINGLEVEVLDHSYAKAERQKRREQKEAKRRRAERPLAVHRNLPHIVAALRSCSEDLATFGLGKVAPFGIIKWINEFTNVQVTGV
jgi:hypothetical protein